MTEPIVVRQLRVDGAVKRSFSGLRVSAPADEIRIFAPFGTPFATLTGPWSSKDGAVYHYWPNRWYNIISLFNADGSCRGLYCDILTPPTLAGGVLETIDLDLDLWVDPDGSFRILDEDEFVEHAALYGYSEELIDGARAGLASLIADLAARSGPFAAIDCFGYDDAAWRLLNGR